MDEQGNECPVGVEGEAVVEMSPNRPVGLFTRYVVKFERSFVRVFVSSILAKRNCIIMLVSPYINYSYFSAYSFRNIGI